MQRSKYFRIDGNLTPLGKVLARKNYQQQKMKLALLFLLCFVSATWQQNIYWSFTPRRVPFYSMVDKSLQANLPILPVSDPSELELYSKSYGYRQLDEQDGIEQRTLERSLGNNFYQRLRTNLDPRAFGFNNYLASLILSSLTLTSTSLFSTTVTVTSFATSKTTITAGTVETCFIDTMFESQTECRRKRGVISSSLLFNDSDDEYLKMPFSSETENTTTSAFELPQEGRDIDSANLIASSQNEERANEYESVPKQTDSSVDRYIRKNRNVVISVTVTSTLTSYSVTYSTSTRTVMNLVSDSSLLKCLPSGFKVCTAIPAILV